MYVRRSKTDQEGRGVVFYAGGETARLARRWLKAAGIADGASMMDLMAAGRWKRADTVAGYTRGQDAARGAVACLRYGAAPQGRETGEKG